MCGVRNLRAGKRDGKQRQKKEPAEKVTLRGINTFEQPSELGFPDFVLHQNASEIYLYDIVTVVGKNFYPIKIRQNHGFDNGQESPDFFMMLMFPSRSR